MGNWAGIRACADVLRNVAAATGDIEQNLRFSAHSLTEDWTGNAADSAQAHLLKIADAAAGAKGPLESMAAEYVTAAEAVADLRDAIGPLISDAGDAAMKAAASAGIVVGAGATKVGLPLALIVGAYTVSRIHSVVRNLRSVISLVSKFRAASETLDSAAHEFGRIGTDLALPTLPETEITVPGPND